MASEVTIEDVARLANVSASTVSNLLNGRTERMRPETLDRVQHAIEQLGYSPNRTARYLKTGHIEMIGVIVPSVANPFYGAFARCIEQAALKHGYQILLGNSERDPERERRYAEEMWSHGIRGLITGSSPLALTHLASLVERGLCIVAFDRSEQSSDALTIDSISVDNVRAAQIATQHLISLGHRRIGFLTGPVRTINRLQRLGGYRRALTDAGIAHDPDLIWEKSLASGFGDTEGIELGRQGVTELLGRANRPTALVAINDMYALGAYAGARDLGRRIPDDLSIVGIDDIVLAQVVDPPLTTVRQPLNEMAATAVETIIQRIENKSSDAPQHVTLAPELIVRKSTTKPSM
ncbi:MAG: LacI family DNA-binding transcriptional regulator [Chloroflexi bacterium]|nr:LacI family DNA-binding transcriptional regulator [Chloroflexota bacterium]